MIMEYREQGINKQNNFQRAIYILLSIGIVLVLTLCMAHIIGSKLLVFAALFGILACLAIAFIRNMALPMLLFFLPWMALMRATPQSFSFFTFGLLLGCIIGVLKSGLHVKYYQILGVLSLSIVTLIAKMMHGYSFSFAYIAFLMMILLFPTLMGEMREHRYSFFHAVVFFSLGIIIAAFCARYFAFFDNIARFIRVDSYSNITRYSGFYGDPNFYAAQVSAALCGCLVLILKTASKRHIALFCVLIVCLLYCGLMSASKSFLLVSVVLLLMWFGQLLIQRGKVEQKVLLIIISALVVVYIASSAFFGDLFDIVLSRLSNANNWSDFTTHRTDIWMDYIDAIFSNIKVLLLGNGFTNIKLNDVGSHNTLIQCIWQFGFIGAPVLIWWVIGFLKEGVSGLFRSKQLLAALMLMSGVFVSWLAIDVLWFDDFFLLQAYVICGLSMGYDCESNELDTRFNVH